MGWPETHRWWSAVREAETIAEADPDGNLPWCDHYAEIFGDRDGLLRALTYRWTVIVQAQLDPDRRDASPAETWQRMTRRHAGLLRVLRRYAADPYDDAPPASESGMVHV